MPRKRHITSRGVYQPKNPSKYVGKHQPVWRSSWELTFMRMADEHNNVLYWASESHRIPYVHPITGKRTTYVPDFFIVYMDAAGKQHAEFVEIKPSTQMIGEATGAYDKAQAIVNEAKWKSATQFCKAHGVKFRVITEREIFNSPQRRKR